MYDDVTKTHHRRVPSKLIRQVSDVDNAHDVEAWIPKQYTAIASSSTIGDALFPRKGEEIEVEYDGEYVRAQVLKCPKHRRYEFALTTNRQFRK